MEYIKVSDKNGKQNNWRIEDDIGDYYEVFHKGCTTTLRKDRCFIFEGKMMSSEIKHLYEDDAEESLGSEQCSVCYREVSNLNNLRVLENTDRYICAKCAKSLKSRVKSVRDM